MNGSGTVAPGTVVAPYLRVIKSSYQIGTCDADITPTLRTPDGAIWGVSQDDSVNAIWKSTDDLTTWQLVAQFPGYTSIEEILPLASGHMLVIANDSSNVRHILRSTDTTYSGTSWATQPSLNMPAGAEIHDPESWFQAGDGTIWVAQYGGPTPMNLWKSTDDGQTFQVAYSANVPEFHSIEPDPYVPGRIWLCIDGANSQLAVGYSDTGGSTWTWVTQAQYPQSRVLDMMFTSDAVYWADDAGDVPGLLYRWDRTTNQITTVLNSLNAPFYNTFSFNGIFAQFSGVEVKTNGYIGDEFIHVITSNSANTRWTETKTPFQRTSGTSSVYAYMTHFTFPDSSGQFWTGFYDINNANFGNASIKFQLDPTAIYNGITAAFTFSPSSPAPGQTVSFDGTSSSTPNPPLTYSWDFGDGSTATGATATHAYTTAGSYNVKLQVKDANNDVTEYTQTVGVGATTSGPPVVSTNPPSGISSSAATLNASVDAAGNDTTAYFQWGTSTAYGSQIPVPAQDLGSGTSSVPFSETLSALSPNTTYHYRVVASNSAGTVNGQDASFTTGPLAPTATTLPASSVTLRTAQLNGTVNPGGGSTTYYFQYGTSTSYGSTTPVSNAGSGTSDVSVSAAISGLKKRATTYHARLVAQNASGTAFGQDIQFTT